MATINKLRQDFKDLNFVQRNYFSWSPQDQEISYSSGDHKSSTDWVLLHEVAHALLNHTNFTTDFNLLRQEVEAWGKAIEISHNYNVTIDKDYIEDCLDTYRNWLYSRSTCPKCASASLQTSDTRYLCHNCNQSWTVSRHRSCRPYRKSLQVEKHI